jgi:hypothetical protein
MKKGALLYLELPVLFTVPIVPRVLYSVRTHTVPGMIFGIDKSQLSEGGVVGAGAVGGGRGGATLVEGVVGHQVSAVHVCRQLRDKTSFLSTVATYGIAFKTTAAQCGFNSTAAQYR